MCVLCVMSNCRDTAVNKDSANFPIPFSFLCISLLGRHISKGSKEPHWPNVCGRNELRIGKS